MSRWYGMGGFWINEGLPQYVAMERKPENGCEIQNSADGVSGVMMRLKLVKTAEEEATIVREDENGLLHGTSILLELTKPWHNKGDRVVCADSYFASVGAAEEMEKKGLGFIGVVKTATKRFPQAYLSTIELENRGDYRGVVSKNPNGRPIYAAFVWMDRDRRYFISSRSSLHEGAPYSRNRLRQVDQTPNAPPVHVDLNIPQPKAAEIYYSTCARIDQHNRTRQDDFELEKKLGTKVWHIRVNHSILGMADVDTYYVGKQCGWWDDETPREFYERLAEEMIDNTLDNRSARRTRAYDGGSASSPAAVVAAHCSPTTKRRKERDGTVTNYSLQGRCLECKRKSSSVCSFCRQQNKDKEPWICHQKTGRLCFKKHCDSDHGSIIE